MQHPADHQPLQETDARELMAPIQSRIVTAVIDGVANARRRFARDELLTADATLRAMALNQSIVTVARTRLRGTAARAEHIGNAWRWNLEDQLLFRFKKAGADGWPVNNYSTRQSLQYVNVPGAQQQTFVKPPDMLTILYTLDLLDEQIVSIDIVRMRGQRDCSWAFPIHSRTGILPLARQEQLPDLPAATQVRFKKSKKKAT